MASENKMKHHFLEIVEKDRLQTASAFSEEILQKARSPLAVLRGRIQSLKEHLANYQQDNAQGILEQIDQLEALLQSATNFVSPDQIMEREFVLPFQVVAQVESFFQFRLSRLNIQVLNLIPQNLEIACESSEFQRVVSYIFTNAIEALEDSTRQTKCIFVQYQRTEANHILSIEDNGPGVSQGALPLLFTPFFTTKKDHTGTSLAICWKVAERAGWKLKVISREKFGTRFEIWIPKSSTQK